MIFRFSLFVLEMLSFSSFNSVRADLLEALLTLPKPREERSRLLLAALRRPKLFFRSLVWLFCCGSSSFFELLNKDKLVMDLLLKMMCSKWQVAFVRNVTLRKFFPKLICCWGVMTGPLKMRCSSAAHDLWTLSLKTEIFFHLRPDNYCRWKPHQKVFLSRSPVNKIEILRFLSYRTWIFQMLHP